MNMEQMHNTLLMDQDAGELDLIARELPLGELSLERLPDELSFTRMATASSLTTFSSAGSCFSSIGSASTVSE
jgi:hypothetical protein